MFHEPKIHGPMRLKILITIGDSEAHEERVNKFNKANIVFFNQDTKVSEEKEGRLMFVTPVLYTPQPSLPGLPLTEEQ